LFLILILEAVPYIPQEPQAPPPKALAFLSLDDSPRFLRRDSDSYWECVTVDAMKIYKTIYEACADSKTKFVSRKYQSARI
jgi:hypothetical protein